MGLAPVESNTLPVHSPLAATESQWVSGKGAQGTEGTTEAELGSHLLEVRSAWTYDAYWL